MPLSKIKLALPVAQTKTGNAAIPNGSSSPVEWKAMMTCEGERTGLSALKLLFANTHQTTCVKAERRTELNISLTSKAVTVFLARSLHLQSLVFSLIVWLFGQPCPKTSLSSAQGLLTYRCCLIKLTVKFNSIAHTFMSSEFVKPSPSHHSLRGFLSVLETLFLFSNCLLSRSSP